MRTPPRPLWRVLHVTLGTITLSCLVLASNPRAQAGAAAAPLFEDDFTGSALDRAKWNVIVTGRTVNNEQQAYVDSTEVLDVRDGLLTIHARFKPGFKTPEGKTFDFVSGRLDTRDKFAFTYG